MKNEDGASPQPGMLTQGASECFWKPPAENRTHPLVNLFGVSCPFYKLSTGLPAGKLPVAIVHSRHEVPPGTLDPVGRPPSPLAAQGLTHREVQDEIEVGPHPPGGQTIGLLHLLHREASAVALIGERRKVVAVGHQGRAGSQGGLHHIPDEGGPGSENEKELRLRRHVQILPMENHLANGFTHPRAAGFTSGSGRNPERLQPLHQQGLLGGFSNPLNAFEGEEKPAPQFHLDGSFQSGA